MALKDALKKVKMPARVEAEDEMLELDMPSEDGEEMPADEEAAVEGPDFSAFSDEELLAEVKARGLKLEEGEGEGEMELELEMGEEEEA